MFLCNVISHWLGANQESALMMVDYGSDISRYKRQAMSHLHREDMGYLSGVLNWGRVMHICISKLTIIGSGDVLSHGLYQAIIWTNVVVLLIGPLGTNLSEMVIEIHTFSFKKKMHLKVSSGKWHLFCLSLNVLMKMAATYLKYTVLAVFH